MIQKCGGGGEGERRPKACMRSRLELDLGRSLHFEIKSDVILPHPLAQSMSNFGYASSVIFSDDIR